MSNNNKINSYTEDDGIEFIDLHTPTQKRTSYADDSDDDFIDLYNDNYEDVDDGGRSTRSHSSRRSSGSSRRQPDSVLSEILSYVKIFVVAIIIAFILTQYVIVNAQVPTGSMKNTIMEGDKLIGFRLAYIFSDPQRGDIVIFKFPDDETENYVKRVIGIPGDVIQIEGGHVYVNGELSPESYLREDMVDTGTEQVYIVPEDCYFMLGDNRNASKDSRLWKNPFVQRKKILAKVIFRYFDGENKRIDFSMIR